MNSLICALFGLMISGACELAADEKYRIAAAHYEKANQIAREGGSNAGQVRSLKKAHAEMQETVWQYPDTEAANRILVDTRINFGAADVERKLSALGVEVKINHFKPSNKIKDTDQGLTEYATASVSGVYDEFHRHITGFFYRSENKPDLAGKIKVDRERNNSSDLRQTDVILIEDEMIGVRTESGLATVAFGTEEKNKFGGFPRLEAPLVETMLPTKLPNKKPDNYHLFTKQKLINESVEPISSFK